MKHELREQGGEDVLAECDVRNRFATAAVTVGPFSILKPVDSDRLVPEDLKLRIDGTTAGDYVLDDLPMWADLWPASFAVARIVDGVDGRGRTALELGCGLGLGTLAAMRRGFDVLATDYSQNALDFTRANVHRNLGKSVRTMLLDWRSPPESLGQFDNVFASDVLYDPPTIRPFASLLKRVLLSTGIALIAETRRTSSGQLFVEMCSSLGLSALNVTSRDIGGLPVDIYEIRQAR